MPVFDVTFVRTGTANIDAPTREAAIAAGNQLNENEVTWTDTWEASDANEIAESARELLDAHPDMAIYSHPFAMAMAIAIDLGYYWYLPTNDNRLFIHHYNENLIEALEDSGYLVERVPETDTRVGAIIVAIKDGGQE